MDHTITDGFIQQMLAASKGYCVMILRGGPKWNQTEIDKIIWEHGRRNFQLRANGTLSIVCPVVDGCDIKGIGIFNANAEETRRIMDEDPVVRAGIKRTSVAASPEIPWQNNSPNQHRINHENRNSRHGHGGQHYCH